ncbi:OsmC family protein [Dinghuibacter silviterrae]|uniref:Osmotically inducible protein OsmC n=1 Tax=Dinghuibacter silviterrae TaxID=1539049 RepID=A0A4R8DTU8_9BACT|nr:OsmC family protein [Dinghuibacter silviterrae]TDX01750.1 osmotically inducible protein OsmC [Dinghuibacter silviterrae]
MTRTATAVWLGSGKDGKGTLDTQSGTLHQTQFSYKSRFEDGVGTNPEELVAAAHSGCFTMKLSFVIGSMGLTPESLETSAAVTLDNGTITSSRLVLKAKVPGMTKEQFDTAVKDAKENCPISKLLNTEITLDATLY